MKQVRYLLSILRPVFSYSFLLSGTLGTIYCFGTSRGKLLTAGFLIIALVGLIMYISEELQENEFILEHFGEKEQKKSAKHHKRAGKRCPQCQKIIYHRRKICQHCGYEFASYKHGEKKKVENAVSPPPTEGPSS